MSTQNKKRIPTATATAEIGISVPFTGDWDPVLAIYTGSAVNALTEIASTHTTGYGITLQVPVQAGITYRIAVDGYDSTESGLFDLSWSIASPTNSKYAPGPNNGPEDM